LIFNLLRSHRGRKTDEKQPDDAPIKINIEKQWLDQKLKNHINATSLCLNE